MNEKDQILLRIRNCLETLSDKEFTLEQAEQLVSIIDNWTLTLLIMQRRGQNAFQMKLSKSS